MTPATSFDPGLTQQYTGALLRAINKDGSFNVRRRGLRGIAGSTYVNLVRMPWGHFLALVAVTLVVVNILFASFYAVLGSNSIRASDDLGLSDFARAFFFSVH